MDLKEKAVEYYNRDFNCAESTLQAANDTEGYGLPSCAIRAIAGFGGGCGCGELSGAVAASIEALSLKYIEEGERSHTVPVSAEECERFISEHKERFSSVLCRDLKEKNYDAEGTKCQKTVEDTCELLAEFLAK